MPNPTPRPWDRAFWGALLVTRKDAPKLLGDAWRLSAPNRQARMLAGEPRRALLFSTRKAAREWCRVQTAAGKAWGWKFRAVRVREIVGVEE